MIYFNKNISFEKVLYEWLNTKTNIKKSSYYKYLFYIDTYLIPYFKTIKFKNITNNDILSFFYSISISKLSNSTKNIILIIIKSSINYGIKKKYRKNNINIDVHFKKNNNISYLTINEQNILENYIRNNMNLRNLCILTALYTGIRIGELCALKYSDIDVINNTISINKSVQRIKDINSNGNKTKLVIDKPKTNSSIRVIPIPKFIVNLLMNDITNINNFIFTNSNKPKDPRSVEKYFSNLLDKLNIKHLKFHSLRHTFATRLREKKVDIKVISELLGHSDWKLTQDIYIHASFEYKKESIKELANIWTQNCS